MDKKAFIQEICITTVAAAAAAAGSQTNKMFDQNFHKSKYVKPMSGSKQN